MSSPNILSTRSFCTIWAIATPHRQLNALRIFDCLAGQLVGLCRVTIQSWAIQTHNWERSEPEMYRELGNFVPLSSWTSVAPEAALTANISALADFILKLRAYCPDCCISWVMSGISFRTSSSGPDGSGLLLTSFRLNVSVCMGSSNPACSLCGNHHCFIFWSVIYHRK